MKSKADFSSPIERPMPFTMTNQEAIAAATDTAELTTKVLENIDYFTQAQLVAIGSAMFKRMSPQMFAEMVNNLSDEQIKLLFAAIQPSLRRMGLL